MIRVLIADDESIFRMGIKSCVHWEDNGFLIVGEAANGKEALSMIRQHKPDILLLDLKMPVMDGIQVMEKACPQYPQMKVIILSCMNDYEYMRKALQLGACDYLFKPVMETDDILKVLLETKEKITAQDCHNQQSAVQYQKRHLLFQNLVAGSLEPDDIKEQFELLQIEWTPESYLCFCIRPYKSASIPLPEKETLFSTSANVINRLFGAREGFHFTAENHMYGVLKASPAEIACGSVSSGLTRVIQQVNEYTGKKIVIGTSRKCTGYQDLQQGLAQAGTALEDSFFTGTDQVQIYREERCQEYDFDRRYAKERALIMNAIELGQAEEARNLLDSVLKQVRDQKQYDKNGICQFVIMILIDSMRSYRSQIIIEKLLGSNINMISEIHQKETLTQVSEEFHSIVSLMLKHVGLLSQSPNLPLILQAQQYVKQHYYENISLDEISLFLNMNKNYFCQIYKKETGEGFIDYVTRIRIDKAMELLSNPKIKTYEVAEAVGYPDYRYFCKIFKRHTGMSPSEAKRLKTVIP